MLIHIFVELFETIAFAFWNTQTSVIVRHFEERKSSNYMYVFVFWYCYYVGVTCDEQQLQQLLELFFSNYQIR